MYTMLKKICLLLMISLGLHASESSSQVSQGLTSDTLYQFLSQYFLYNYSPAAAQSVKKYSETAVNNCVSAGSCQSATDTSTTCAQCLAGAQAQNDYSKAVSRLNSILGGTCINNGSCSNYNDTSQGCTTCLMSLLAQNCDLYSDIRFLMLPPEFKDQVAKACAGWTGGATNAPIQYNLVTYYLYNPANLATPPVKEALDEAWNKYVTQSSADSTTWLTQNANATNVNPATYPMNQVSNDLQLILDSTKEGGYFYTTLLQIGTLAPAFFYLFNNDYSAKSKNPGINTSLMSPYFQYFITALNNLGIPSISDFLANTSFDYSGTNIDNTIQGGEGTYGVLTSLRQMGAQILPFDSNTNKFIPSVYTSGNDTGQNLALLACYSAGLTALNPACLQGCAFGICPPECKTSRFLSKSDTFHLPGCIACTFGNQNCGSCWQAPNANAGKFCNGNWRSNVNSLTNCLNQSSNLQEIIKCMP